MARILRPRIYLQRKEARDLVLVQNKTIDVPRNIPKRDSPVLEDTTLSTRRPQFLAYNPRYTKVLCHTITSFGQMRNAISKVDDQPRPQPRNFLEDAREGVIIDRRDIFGTM